MRKRHEKSGTINRGSRHIFGPFSYRDHEFLRHWPCVKYFQSSRLRSDFNVNTGPVMVSQESVSEQFKLRASLAGHTSDVRPFSVSSGHLSNLRRYGPFFYQSQTLRSQHHEMDPLEYGSRPHQRRPFTILQNLHMAHNSRHVWPTFLPRSPSPKASFFHPDRTQ